MSSTTTPLSSGAEIDAPEFRPARVREVLVAFRPLEYLESWDDGFGKPQPAVVCDAAALERVERDRPHLDAGGLRVPVKEARVKRVTVRHGYLVEALRDAVGGIVAGRIGQAGTAWALLPPALGEYGSIVTHCRSLGWV
ncbi:hypothetical protein AB0G79_20130 [Streptomyces sp. NPDC020807]|uniref:hypothetical protein n=1 Tax=Streptomyces sp. NPDC020807 TaxID=3155119 RepID=UPI003407866B